MNKLLKWFAVPPICVTFGVIHHGISLTIFCHDVLEISLFMKTEVEDVPQTFNTESRDVVSFLSCLTFSHSKEPE